MLGRFSRGLMVMAFAAASAAHAQSQAGDYPNRPIKVIVPFSPGALSTAPCGRLPSSWAGA